MAVTAPKHIWQPLEVAKQEIRLLRLQPALQGEERIQCELQTVSLLDEPSYDALSYCWGESSNRQSVLLHGHAHTVTDNLFAALRALRLGDEIRCLWIDAICINQNDLEERASQVAMMGAIYRSAEIVRIWMGASSALKDDEKVRKQIINVASRPQAHFDGGTEVLSTELVFLNPWWKRSWTVQEVILARHPVFHLGIGEIPLNSLVSYTTAIGKHLLAPSACCRGSTGVPGIHFTFFSTGLDAVESVLSYRTQLLQDRIELLDVISDHRNREATDLRDKIYAFAGLVRKLPDNLVSYTGTIQDGYVRFASRQIQESARLEPLRFVVSVLPTDVGLVSRRGLHGLPTWCPDWSNHIEPDSKRLDTPQRSLEDIYTAAGSTNACVEFPEPHILEASGVICDTIRKVGGLQQRVIDVPCVRGWSALLATTLREDGMSCPTGFKFGRSLDTASSLGYSTRSSLSSARLKADASAEAKSTTPPPISDRTHRLRAPRASSTAREKQHIHGADTVLNDWDQLICKRYPHRNDESFQDAFRLALLGDHQPVLPKPTSKDQVHDEYLLKMCHKITFIRIWDSEIERRKITLLPRGRVEAWSMLFVLTSINDTNMQGVHGLMSATTNRRRFVISDKRYIGLGPAQVQENDVICVLHGCRMPCVLRKRVSDDPEGPEEWSFVGCAYVHGLMNGEAIEKENRGEMKSRKFRIR